MSAGLTHGPAGRQILAAPQCWGALLLVAIAGAACTGKHPAPRSLPSINASVEASSLTRDTPASSESLPPMAANQGRRSSSPRAGEARPQGTNPRTGTPTTPGTGGAAAETPTRRTSQAGAPTSGPGPGPSASATPNPGPTLPDPRRRVGVDVAGPPAPVITSGPFAQILLRNSDGSGDPSPLVGPVSPDPQAAWSPDGKHLAFVRQFRADDTDISVINADGSFEKNLTTNPGLDSSPAWSPDGQRIAFVSNRGSNTDIYLMNIDGTALKRLTSDPAIDYKPTWLPDGQAIVFASTRSGHQELYVMGPDDGEAIPILQTDIPALSVKNEGGNFDIYLFNSQGKGSVRRLTDDPAEDREPTWSPDGTKIAFTSSRDGNEEVYVMNADGSGQLNLTKNSDIDNSPRWSPDGKRLAFVSERDGNPEIYLMNADGSSPTNLSRNIAVEGQPSWSPDGRLVAFLR